MPNSDPARRCRRCAVPVGRVDISQDREELRLSQPMYQGTTAWQRSNIERRMQSRTNFSVHGLGSDGKGRGLCDGRDVMCDGRLGRGSPSGDGRKIAPLVSLRACGNGYVLANAAGDHAPKVRLTRPACKTTYAEGYTAARRGGGLVALRGRGGRRAGGGGGARRGAGGRGRGGRGGV